MKETDRRIVLRNAGLAVTAAAIGEPLATAQAQTQTPKVASPNQTAELPNDLTRRLARFIVSARFVDMPEAVRHEAKRTLLNWVGCAVGGSQHETVTNAVAALAPFFGARQATLLGRSERMDVLHAALLNGISSHVLDFDDTHAQTTIHPAAPVAPAILALAEYRPVSGQDFIEALVIGVEAECRIGKAAVPAHYDAGWHITGTAGVFGSAAAAGKLLGLNEQQMCWALGLAAAQPVGLIEMFGSMTKSFHPGRAAQNGLAAAHLAAKGFTASEHGLEAHFGWLNVLSTERNHAALDGEGWEILKNSYKPFACGLVVHPVIDGCIQLRNRNRLTADMIERVEVAVHPRVMQITAIKDPKTGLEGKFSVYHAAAVAIVEGAAGERQFSDEAVRAPATVGLRQRVFPTIDPAVGKDQARITIALKNGERPTVFVEHAVGSVENPMSDRMIEGKFHGLAEGILATDQARSIVDLCWRADQLADAGEVARGGGKA
jgi:2-methylcitrate dehydratase PrpD